MLAQNGRLGNGGIPVPAPAQCVEEWTKGENGTAVTARGHCVPREHNALNGGLMRIRKPPAMTEYLTLRLFSLSRRFFLANSAYPLNASSPVQFGGVMFNV